MKNKRLTHAIQAGLGLLLALALPSLASAGWLGVRNSLTQPVVVQITEKKPGAQAGTTQRLHPGEITWTWVDPGATHRILVQTSELPRQIVATQEVTAGKLDALYSLEKKGTVATQLAKQWE